MEILLVLIPFSLIFIVLALQVHSGGRKIAQNDRQWERICGELASACGLSHTKELAFGGIDGIKIRIFREVFWEAQTKSNAHTIGFAVTPPGLAKELEIRPEGVLSRLSRITGNTDIELADQIFDNAAKVTGIGTHQARALLHPEARRLIAELIDESYNRRFFIIQGVIETRQETWRCGDSRKINDVLQKILLLARFLTRTGPPEALLQENYFSDNNGKSRILYIDSRAALEGTLSPDDGMVKDALADNDLELQFHAAKAIGPAGYMHLPEILCRAEVGLARQIIDYLQVRKAQETIPAILSVFPRIRDWPTKTALIRFLASVGNEAVERFLRDQLTTAEGAPVDYARECVRGLGQCGSLDSIAVLHALETRAFRREIEQAVAAIMQRHGIRQSGWLSVEEAGAAGGDLSITDEER